MVASVVANIISSTPHPMAHRTGRWNFVQGQARKDWTKSRESIFWCLFQCQNVPLMVSIFKKSLYVYIYMVTFTIHIPQMLAYIYIHHTWILWAIGILHLLGFETTTRITRCLLEFLAQDSTPRAVGEWNFSAVTRIVGLYSSSCPWDVFIPSYMHTHIHVYIYILYLYYIYIHIFNIYICYISIWTILLYKRNMT
jgi:hypothetical protein